MKLLLVMDSPQQHSILSDYVESLGFDTIWYRFVLKAMDNLDEISPDGIFINAQDFPRHWKTLISFYRSSHLAQNSPVLVLHGDHLAEKEAEKARHLNVNCLMNVEKIESKESLDSLRRVLQSTIPAQHWLKNVENSRIKPKHLSMIITHPHTGVLISGKIKKITSFGAVFVADYLELTRNFELSTVLNGCSLRAGNAILSPSCKIISIDDDAISFEFISFTENEKKILENFLARIA
ncbi:MAG: hypothetical protein Ta2B_08200 [Termitinemataceae bacterium]|nr:MAG: hypothetical protein Ta2B_08200 [Termitinemataceae bacterium]